jgi:hypothetical protein
MSDAARFLFPAFKLLLRRSKLNPSHVGTVAPVASK